LVSYNNTTRCHNPEELYLKFFYLLNFKLCCIFISSLMHAVRYYPLHTQIPSITVPLFKIKLKILDFILQMLLHIGHILP
jgi:hypothetical protein